MAGQGGTAKSREVALPETGFWNKTAVPGHIPIIPDPQDLAIRPMSNGCCHLRYPTPIAVWCR